MWSILAIYGSELIKSERETGKRDEARATTTLRSIWRNVISMPGSAREARTQFETGYADALITWELEAVLMKQAGGEMEIVVPEPTIFSEHPTVVIDRNVTAEERPVINAFIQYLWTEEALEMGDRIAVLNAGHIEQIGSLHEVYNRPETEFVATFLGAANLLLGVVAGQNVSVGTVMVPCAEEVAQFEDGQSVKIVFRPEDVCLSRTGEMPAGARRLVNGVVEEISFVGAYERLSVRLDLSARQPALNEPPLYSVAPGSAEHRMGVPVIVTRPKSEAASMLLSRG